MPGRPSVREGRSLSPVPSREGGGEPGSCLHLPPCSELFGRPGSGSAAARPAMPGHAVPPSPTVHRPHGAAGPAGLGLSGRDRRAEPQVKCQLGPSGTGPLEGGGASGARGPRC